MEIEPTARTLNKKQLPQFWNLQRSSDETNNNLSYDYFPRKITDHDYDISANVQVATNNLRQHFLKGHIFQRRQFPSVCLYLCLFLFLRGMTPDLDKPP